jgi:hypothetical protein
MKRYFYLVVVVLISIVTLVDARKLLVGPQRAYHAPSDVVSAVQTGDTVEIDTGLYSNQAFTWNANNTVFRGATKFAHLKAPAVIPNQKAIMVITGNNTVLENIEFSDASVPDQNGAGIRQEGSNVTIRNCYFHNCEDGILGGSGYVVIENSEFSQCGYGDGYSHNMYISACDSFMLRFCYTHDASEGHTVKSRAFKNYILYNRIESANSTTSYEINLPNAGTSFIIGNQIQQGPNSHNSAIIDFGSEGLSGHDTSLYVINNTIVNDRGSGTFISISSTQNRPKVYNNLFVGGGTLCSRQMDSAGNVSTNSPVFADKANFDYHLTSTSPALNKEIDPGSARGFSLSPQFQYVYNTSGVSRTISGSALDAGAYEYNNASVMDRPLRLSSYNSGTIQAGLSLVYDMRGRRLPDIKPDVRQKLPPGAYFVNFRSSHGNIIKRVMVTN